MDEKELYHHGIKGMKWGVRRTDAQLGHKTNSSGKKSDSDDTKKKKSSIGSKTLSSLKNKIEAGKKAREAARAKKEAETQKKTEENISKINPKKSAKQMSDSELRERINRLRMEKEYKELMNNTRNEKIKKGTDFALRIMERSGEELLTQVVKHYGATGFNHLIGKQVIFANNKKKS